MNARADRRLRPADYSHGLPFAPTARNAAENGSLRPGRDAARMRRTLAIAVSAVGALSACASADEPPCAFYRDLARSSSSSRGSTAEKFDTADQYLCRALDAHAQGRKKEAADWLERALDAAAPDKSWLIRGVGAAIVAETDAREAVHAWAAGAKGASLAGNKQLERQFRDRLALFSARQGWLSDAETEWLTLFKDLPPSRKRGQVAVNLALIAQKREDWRTVSKWAAAAISDLRTSSYSPALSAAYSLLGNGKQQTKDFPAALDAHRSGVELAERFGNQTEQMDAQIDLAQTASQAGEFEVSLRAYERAAELARKVPSLAPWLEWLEPQKRETADIAERGYRCGAFVQAGDTARAMRSVETVQPDRRRGTAELCFAAALAARGEPLSAARYALEAAARSKDGQSCFELQSAAERYGGPVDRRCNMRFPESVPPREDPPAVIYQRVQPRVDAPPLVYERVQPMPGSLPIDDE